MPCTPPLWHRIDFRAAHLTGTLTNEDSRAIKVVKGVEMSYEKLLKEYRSFSKKTTSSRIWRGWIKEIGTLKQGCGRGAMASIIGDSV